MTVSEFPVPIEFELPNAHWRRLEPAEAGLTNVAFAAGRHGTEGGYTPVLTITGGWREDVEVATVADESLAVLRADTGVGDLVDRSVVESETAPAVTQLMASRVEIDGASYDLRQGQVVAAAVDVDHPARRALMVYTVTCTAEQWPTVGREFQDFMASVRYPDHPGTS